MDGRFVSEYYVFLASPGDVQSERDAVRWFFNEYNATLVSSGRSLRFEVIDWENYSTIGVGRPQELITEQTLEKLRGSLALVIGIMGQRFGSPSGTHESGTEEEFEWAFSSNQKTGWPEVKWFFRNADEVKFPSDPKLARAALDQWDKVCKFRESLNQGKKIFLGEFKDSADFREVLRKDLSLWLEATDRPWRKIPGVRSVEVDRKPPVKSPVPEGSEENYQQQEQKPSPSLSDVSIEPSDEVVLADLLVRSGRASYTARRALCIQININPDELNFLAQTSDSDFALQFVNHLKQRDDRPSILRLRDVLHRSLGDNLRKKLADITRRLIEE